MLLVELFSKKLNESEEQYGWWVTDRGDLIDVYTWQHEKVARSHLDPDSKSGKMGYILAAEKNWVRIANEKIFHSGKKVFNINPKGNFISMRAYRTIAKLVKDLQFDTILFETFRENKNFSDFEIPRFLNCLRSYVKEPAMAESLLREAHEVIPYGFWITQTGTLIEVPYEGHYRKALEMLRSKYPRCDDGYVMAEKEGWVRLQTEKEMAWSSRPITILNIDLMAGRMTVPALRTFEKLIKQYYWQKFFVENRTDLENIQQFKFNDEQIPKLLAKLKEYTKVPVPEPVMAESRRRRKIRENEDNSLPYGFWCDNFGNIHKVDYQEHDSTIKNIFKKNGHYVGDDENFVSGYELGKKNNWVRLLVEKTREGPKLCIQIMSDNISIKTLRGLEKLVKTHYFSSFLVDHRYDYDRNHDCKVGYKSFTEEETNKLFSYLKTFIGNVEPVKQPEPVNAMAMAESRKRKLRENNAVLPYGYWCSADGEFFEVDDFDHNSTIRDVFRKKGYRYQLSDSGYDLGRKYGWVRLVVEGGMSRKPRLGIQILSDHISIKSIRSLEKFVKTHYFNSFVVDHRYNNDYDYENFKEDETNKLFSYLKTFVGEPAKPVRDMAMAESRRRRIKENEEIQNLPYGYWILSNGELLEVPFESHSDIIRDYFGSNEDWFGGYDLAKDHNCVRLQIENRKSPNPKLNIQLMNSTMSKESFMALRKIIKTHYFASFGCDIYKDSGSYQYFTEDQMNKLISWLRSRVKEPEKQPTVQPAPQPKEMAMAEGRRRFKR